MRTLSLPPAEVWISSDTVTLNRAAADEIARVMREAVTRSGRCTMALAGGSTPRGTYAELAAGTKSGARPLPFEALQVFFSDERMVPLDHPDSNYRMAREAWLGQIPNPAANLHPVDTALEPPVAASRYEAEIRAASDQAEATPQFDLILLGLGSDGHTASLFPGTEALQTETSLVTSNWVPKLQAHRVTFTFPLLNQARQILFLVAGADKAQVVREVLQPIPGRPAHPAARVHPAQGRLLWLLDNSAAAQLA